MRKLLQINVVSNMLSTGKIAEDISKIAIVNRWETYVAFGRWAKKSVSHEVRIAPMLNTYIHYIENRLFDNEGLSSRYYTKRLIRKIEDIKPDIIHLHNIHDHYLNYPILFEYLSKLETPIVWTQHDCWSFTGGCSYFDLLNCEGWKHGCKNCPEKRALFCNKSEMQFSLKKYFFNKPALITFVPVSDWLANLLKCSYLRHNQIITIHNGIDINQFKISKNSKFDNKFRIIGVASPWSIRKGLDDFIKLRSKLSDEFLITLIGLSEKQISKLPHGIHGIKKTTDINTLAELYSESDVFVNPTYEDNFPTVNLEALACGTPVITYNTGGSPEAICEKTGVVVEQGNIDKLVDEILKMRKKPLSSLDCRKRAEEYFNQDKCFKKYIDLYEDLLRNR